MYIQGVPSARGLGWVDYLTLILSWSDENMETWLGKIVEHPNQVIPTQVNEQMKHPVLRWKSPLE